MSDPAQLLFIKLILLAAETYNKMPKNEVILIQALRSKLEVGQLKEALNEIKTNFPKFKHSKGFYYFDDFEHKTNFIPDKQLLSNRSAIAKHTVEEEKEEDKEEEKAIATFFSYFLLKTKKAFKLTEANKKIIKARLVDGYTIEQLKKAVDNFVLDDWVERINNLDLIYCIGKQSGKPDVLEKWLNFKPTEKFIKP
jgi:uncharacterized phage protein (TIGR02220 family)